MIATSPVVHLVDAMESVVLAESCLEKGTFAMEHTIDDYPIGGNRRGACKMGVESKPNCGIRSVKTTTNKHGKWCAPKCSTYRDGRTTKMFVMTSHPEVERAVWVTVSMSGGNNSGGGVYLCDATNNTKRIAGCPFPSVPSRCALAYKDGEHGLPASAKKEIEAYDAWALGLSRLCTRIRIAIEHHEGVLAQVAK
jgi:hypothetical protein